MTSDGVNNYAWDAVCKLVSVTYPGTGNSTTLSYDAFGRNVQIVEATAGSVTDTTQPTWCGSQIAEIRENGGVLARRFFDLGEIVASSKYLFTLDHIRSIRDVTDVSGTALTCASYDPYGFPRLSGFEPDFLFAHFYWHARSSQMLAMHRPLSALTGRWLTRDPLTSAERSQGPNLYTYVQNDLVNKIDPLGLAWIGNSGLSALCGAWLGPLSDSPKLDNANLEVAHQHIFFEDGKSPSNYGYGPSGKFSVPSPAGYHQKPGHYDDCIMRKAVDSVNWKGENYSLVGHNCQDWASAVVGAYDRLAKDPKVREECCKSGKSNGTK